MLMVFDDWNGNSYRNTTKVEKLPRGFIGIFLISYIFVCFILRSFFGGDISVPMTTR